VFQKYALPGPVSMSNTRMRGLLLFVMLFLFVYAKDAQDFL
jgi:hypothetical protein